MEGTNYTNYSIVYYPRLVKITGDIKGAIFLSRLLHWIDEQNSGWINKTQQEIEEETGLSRYEQENIRKKLRTKGFLLEKYEGVPRKLFFAVNIEKIKSSLNITGE